MRLATYAHDGRPAGRAETARNAAAAALYRSPYLTAPRALISGWLCMSSNCFVSACPPRSYAEPVLHNHVRLTAAAMPI